MDISRRLNEMKETRGITLPEIEEKSGVPLQTLRRIFDGTTRDPGVNTMQAIVARGLGYRLDDLFSSMPLPSDEALAEAIPKVIAESTCPISSATISAVKREMKNASREAICDIFEQEACKFVRSDRNWWRATALVETALIIVITMWYIFAHGASDVHFADAACMTQYILNTFHV
jgi:transcriptional regulator with XRE-family HTH domain